MSWVEVEMNWVERNGAEWRRVHSLVIPLQKRAMKVQDSSL